MAPTHIPPTVRAGDVIRVHVPPLPDLWTVDAVLSHAGSWGYFLRISQRVEGGRVGRTIAPRGFEIVNRADDLPARVKAAIRYETAPRVRPAARGAEHRLDVDEGMVPLSVPVEFSVGGRVVL